MQQSFSIQVVSWQSDYQQSLKAIREQVFIQEQKVPIELEWDGEDESATHLIALHQNTPVGCARIVKNQTIYKIGRMAVLTDWRGKGIGKALLQHAIQDCKQNTHLINLSAQTKAIPFYEQAGFIVTSRPYLDANIWHADMQLDISG